MELLNSMRSSKVIELTHSLRPSIPTWTAECGFQQNNDLDYHSHGIRAQSVHSFAGAGTHMDSPAHFFEGKEDIAAYPSELFFLEGAVIDVRQEVLSSDTYFVTADNICDHEKKYGKLSANNMVLFNTGWHTRWPDVQRYRNPDSSGQMMFPGVSPKAGELLLERGVKVIAIDTLSPDGCDESFPFHNLWLGSGNSIIENLNLRYGGLPMRGSTIVNLPQKVAGATEASTRIIALLSKQ
jgi:kynurenine formamidase